MWADFGHGQEETYLALWRPESQIFPSTSNAVPLCGSYWNYTFISDPQIFLLWIASSIPSAAAVPTPRGTSSALSLFTCKVLAAGIINSCQGSLERGDLSLWLVCTVLQCTALLLPRVCALEKPGLLATASSLYWCCSPALKQSLRLGH